MFALAMTLHLLQPSMSLHLRPPTPRFLAAAGDAVIAPPPVPLREPQPAFETPPGLALEPVDLHAGGIGLGDVAAGMGGVMVGHVCAIGLGVLVALAGGGAHSEGEFFSTAQIVGILVALVADVVGVPAMAAQFARLGAGDAIAGSKLTAFVRALLVHITVIGLAFGDIAIDTGATAALGVVIAVVDLIGTPLAASWGLHERPDRPDVSPAAALRSQIPSLGRLALGR